MSRQLLEQLTPQHWDSSKPAQGSGFQRVRWLQGLSDLINRPAINRATAITSATAVTCNGTFQSSGIGTQALKPKRYAEFTVKARVTFNINSNGQAFVYVFRTPGTIPPNGSAPGPNDVAVGGDAFVGGQLVSGAQQVGAFSYLDTGLDVSKSYAYYLVVSGPMGDILNLVNNSQVLVMERS